MQKHKVSCNQDSWLLLLQLLVVVIVVVVCVFSERKTQDQCWNGFEQKTTWRIQQEPERIIQDETVQQQASTATNNDKGPAQ